MGNMEHEQTTTSLVAVLAALLCCFPGCHHSGGPELGQAPSPPPTPPPTKHMRLIIDTRPSGARVGDTGLRTPFEVSLEVDLETKNLRAIDGRQVDPWDPDAKVRLESGLRYENWYFAEGGHRKVGLSLGSWGGGKIVFDRMTFTWANAVWRLPSDYYYLISDILESGEDTYVLRLEPPPGFFSSPPQPPVDVSPLVRQPADIPPPEPQPPDVLPPAPQPADVSPPAPPYVPPVPPPQPPPSMPRPPRQPREVTCPTCGGTGFIVCPGCQGRCYLGKCTVCNGTGQRWVNGTNVGCTNCNSTGRMKCRMCLSADIPQGKIPCKRCNGTGKVTVP